MHTLHLTEQQVEDLYWYRGRCTAGDLLLAYVDPDTGVAEFEEHELWELLEEVGATDAICGDCVPGLDDAVKLFLYREIV